MKNKFLPLFWKFTLAILLIVAIFGSLNLYFINDAFFELSNKEINRHCITTANIIAERSIDPILYNDIPYLDKMVTGNLKTDSSIAYLIIYDESNNVLAHSFKNNIPKDLFNVFKIEEDNQENLVRIIDKNDPEKIIRIFTTPILDGSLGYVSVGIYEDNFINSIQSINRFFLSMIALFLLIGVLGAFIFSYIITIPLKRISKISENLNLDSLEISNGNRPSSLMYNSYLKAVIKFKVRDEIDVLTNKFYEMVSRLQKAYAELKNTQESLRQSEKVAAIGKLSAGIAHEINNPITGIQNCLKRISNDPNNIKQNITYIELMDDSINKIKTVVQELLNFSKKRDITFIEVNVKKLIENVLVLSAYQLEQSRISISKKYPRKVPLIQASPNHIEQVLLNLIINAIDAIDELKNEKEDVTGEICITISSTDHHLLLQIKDNGIGVTKENINHIFDPFFTLKKINPGTGIGLAVSLNIIKEHRGHIRARKNQNGGMTFIISLPFNPKSR